MNMSEFLNNIESEEVILRRLHDNLFFTGSRSVLPSYVTEKTDHDFMAEYSPEIVEWLTKNGFTDKYIDSHYMDDATIMVFESALVNAQVVLKKPEYYKNCLKMWDIFRSNPALFRDYFWKSNPTIIIDRNTIRMRINAFLKFLEV